MEIVATRELELLNQTGSTSKVTVKICKPVPADGGGFKCEVHIEGLDVKGPPPIMGEDSLQALGLALSITGVFLVTTEAGRQGRLKWLGLDDLGFSFQSKAQHAPTQ